MDIETELIVKIYGDNVLRQKAEEVTDFGEELVKLSEEMFEIMRKKRGVGLAAPQVGLSKRFFVVELDNENIKMAIANPEITYKSDDEVVIEEGCLSVPGVFADITRPRSIIMIGQDLQGNKIQITASGFLARVMQHEFDHLEGTLFVDYLDENQMKSINSTLKKLSKRK